LVLLILFALFIYGPLLPDSKSSPDPEVRQVYPHQKRPGFLACSLFPQPAMDMDDDMPPELVETGQGGEEDVVEKSVKVPITIVTGNTSPFCRFVLTFMDGTI
jgi:hypothetical protein